MSRKHVRAIAALAIGAVGAVNLAASSSTTGALTGKAVDTAGRANESVKVTVFAGDKPLGTAYSDSDGKFTVGNLPAGNGYTIVAVRQVRITTLNGRKAGVVVKAGETTDVGNIELQLGNPE